MDRCKRSVRLGGLGTKRDTPVKPALSRRNAIRRFLPSKHYEALPEECEVGDPTVQPNKPVWADVLPVPCKSVLRSSIPANTKNPKRDASSPATPATTSSVSQSGHPHIQVTASTDAVKDDEMPSRQDEGRSITSSSMEIDTTFNSDDDDDEDWYSLGSSSSLPSPEIFRKETCVEAPTLRVNEKLPGLNLHIKNSTLLDESYAKSINMHCSPNLSTIIDASTILAEQSTEIRDPEPEVKPQTDSFKSDIMVKKTPAKLTIRRPILCKKKVWFKSPIIAETFKINHTPASKLTLHSTSEPFQTPSPCVQMKETVMLESSPEKPKFFDFLSDSDRNAFFQKMSERSVKLRSFVLFPLKAALHIEPSVL